MEITQYYMTKNGCYIDGASNAKYRMIPKGIVVHSTGANNNKLNRYIGPDDGIIGSDKYADNDWNRIQAKGKGKMVHAFIGLDKDGKVRCYNTLPWEYKPWGCGGGSKGSFNETHIQFEIQEDDLTDQNYYNEAFSMAQQLCAYLCRKYQLPVSSIVSHQEANRLGYASNHDDPSRWLAKYGDNMDKFRDKVAALLGSSQPVAPQPEVKPVEVPAVKQLVRVDDYLNVRDKPANSGKVIGKLLDGATVDTYGKAGDGWVIVAMGDKRGYAYGKFLMDVPAPVVEKPIKTAMVFNLSVGDQLNVRDAANGATIVGKLSSKNLVDVYEESKGWCRIKAGSISGWAIDDYLVAPRAVSEFTTKVQMGDSGDRVKEVQARLIELKYDLGSAGADGKFGAKTDAAVKSYQGKNKLKADGIVGAATWKVLFN